VKEMTAEQAKTWIINSARYGDRVVQVVEPKPKTIWGGLGNRSGLHSYADKLIRDKWEKSSARFIKKLDKLLQPYAKFQIQQFQNINRDRGKWVAIQMIVVG
jgi:hypothetical protein